MRNLNQFPENEAWIKIENILNFIKFSTNRNRFGVVDLEPVYGMIKDIFLNKCSESNMMLPNLLWNFNPKHLSEFEIFHDTIIFSSTTSQTFIEQHVSNIG